jgi:type IV secretory pathway VirD2 relaxase
MSESKFEPKLGHMGDPKRSSKRRYTSHVLYQAHSNGMRPRRKQYHISHLTPRRGMAVGVRASAGLISPGSRRVIVKIAYSSIEPGKLGAAKAYLRYIQRDAVTRDGGAGRLYDATSDAADSRAFLDRSHDDPHLFRIIVSAEDGSRLPELKPFIRDLMRQVERDLDARVDWIGVDHFNTGHPHTHLFIRGRDDEARDLVLARDYFMHGIRSRAQGLITLELGPESELERIRKLFNEVRQDRLTQLDRSLVSRAKAGTIDITSGEERDQIQQTQLIGRLKSLERLGLAREREPAVWSLDNLVETRLRQLGERAEKFRIMQRALREAGVERGASAMALFDGESRKTPLVGKVVGVGVVDTVSKCTWVVVDAIDGRNYYAEFKQLKTADLLGHGMLVALENDFQNAPSAAPHLKVLSAFEVKRLVSYEGPTWLDRAIIDNFTIDNPHHGFGAELRRTLAMRQQWLASKKLAELLPDGNISPQPQMMTKLRELETTRLARELSGQLKADFIPTEPGSWTSGIYERAIKTPSGKIAVIRREDTFTLAPWKPALEPMRGRVVTGRLGPDRVVWALDRGRVTPARY